MANDQPHPSLTHGHGGVLTGGTDPTGHPLPPVFDPPPVTPPMDPGEIAQIELLNEAVLNLFAADFPMGKPFVANTLRWDITMPTTVISGVSIDVRLAEVVEGSTNPGYADDLPPVGSRPAAVRRPTTYTLALVAPKATRVLGSVTIELDLSGCRSFFLSSLLVTDPVKTQLTNGFPPGGIITLRTPPTIGVHLEALTVDLALAVDGPAFFNPDASVSVSWTLSGEGPAWNAAPYADAMIVSAISTAQTLVDIGLGYTLSSLGVANAVSAAVQAVSDGYLYQLVGPLIAQQVVGSLYEVMSSQRPPGWIFHHLDVVADGLTFWYAPHP
jgi:hypothetical protein